jgi:hypothetical protein
MHMRLHGSIPCSGILPGNTPDGGAARLNGMGSDAVVKGEVDDLLRCLRLLGGATRHSPPNHHRMNGGDLNISVIGGFR